MVGLDYSSIPAVLQMQGIKRKEWSDIFAGLQIMEAAAIPVLSERYKPKS